MPDEGRRGDLEWGTIPRVVRSAAERFGDASAIEDVDADVTLTFTEVAAAARRAAKGFLAIGIEAGDRVAVWAPNIWEWVVAAVGLQSVGGVLVPLNTRYRGVEAAYILEKSRARALVTVEGFLDTDDVGLLRRAVDVPTALPELGTIVCLRGDAPDGTVGWDTFLTAGDAIGDAVATERADAVAPDDRSDILFTSGTTGAPKGVITHHAQNIRAYRDWADVIGLETGDRYLIVNPFFHSFGYKSGWLVSLMMGVTILPQAVFDGQVVMDRIAPDRISVLTGAPALFQTILHHPRRAGYDLSTLRLAVTGAASIPVELIVGMRDTLGFQNVITGYGLTEASGIVTMCRHDDDPETVARTSGRAIPGVEVRCVDDDGTEVPRGEPGEVVVRGYNIMEAYFDDAEETAATIDADGWLHTGDVGVMDDRGYVAITDRTKDMFIVGGFNAYPAEIENLLLGNDAIAQVAVIGVPDDRLGEVGMAWVMLRPDATLTADELIGWSRETMANFKVPRYVEFVTEFPMNATGKVLKFELRARAAALLAGAG